MELGSAVIVRTIVKSAVLPSSLMTITALAGLILATARVTRKAGCWVGLMGLLIYLVFGSGPVSFLLLGALEWKIAPSSLAERQTARAIVVLTGYGENDSDRPLSSRVDRASNGRLLEALILHQIYRELPLIVSGTEEVAHIMREVLVSAGVPPGQILVEDRSTHTYESAIQVAPIVGADPFMLVTSAGHMPRAIGAFRRVGTHPLPVPTDYLTKRNPLATTYLPSPTHLHLSDLAISELVAIAWYWYKGQWVS